MPVAVWASAALLAFLALVAPADAQVLFATRPHPQFAVGPLFIQGNLEAGVRDVPVELMFGVIVPAGRSALEFEQDLYLLWPGQLAGPIHREQADAGLAREVSALGLTVLEQGRLALVAQRHYESATDAEPIAGGAPFVTFVRAGGPPALVAPATYIKIPWTPRLANPAWLVSVRLTAKDLVKPQPATWLTRTFLGPRDSVAIGYADVGSRSAFALYFARRDRVVPVMEPARLLLSFGGADRLSIEQIAPPSGGREPSPSLPNTVLVSLFLPETRSVAPQLLTVHFGYLSGLQSWGPILIPAVFFILGNMAAVLARGLAERLQRRLAGRVQLRLTRKRPPLRRQGVILSPEQLAKIVPGVTTYAELLRACGDEREEEETSAGLGRKTVVYRGRRSVPMRGWQWGWLSTVRGWEVEHHTVEILVERSVVVDVQTRLRRTHADRPTAPA